MTIVPPTARVVALHPNHPQTSEFYQISQPQPPPKPVAALHRTTLELRPWSTRLGKGEGKEQLAALSAPLCWRWVPRTPPTSLPTCPPSHNCWPRPTRGHRSLPIHRRWASDQPPREGPRKVTRATRHLLSSMSRRGQVHHAQPVVANVPRPSLGHCQGSGARLQSR